jgi:hypothetical protein
VTNVKVYAIYAYTENAVVNADVSVNSETCSEIGSGIYNGELTDWSPLQSFVVEVEPSNFEQAKTTVLNLHILNTIMYVAIGLAIVLSVAVVVLRKKQERQRLEQTPSENP